MLFLYCLRINWNLIENFALRWLDVTSCLMWMHSAHWMPPVMWHEGILAHITFRHPLSVRRSIRKSATWCTPGYVCIKQSFLPTASEGWGKVMFSVCPHLGWVSRVPPPPPIRSGWGYPPSDLERGNLGYPPSDLDGGYPGYPHVRPGWGGYPDGEWVPTSVNRWSTW